MTRLRAVLVLTLLLGLAAVGVPGDGEAEAESGFLPREALGVGALQRKMVEADGRGVLVAVLDTGVDLLHEGLARTPDGKPKVVDFYDATDSGRVETSIPGLAAEGSATGLSGRKLSLPSGVPSEVRLGLVRAVEIYPGRLLRRLRAERKKAREKERRLSADRHAGKKVPPAPRDTGDPVHDLVLYRQADSWRVLVDTDCDGDLTDERVLREYGVAQEIAVLGNGARLGVGVRVEREGDAVSLLFDGGGHGSHVAGIVAGYHGEDSPLNGLAPGASILAVKVGNTRYGGATTHLAIMRGLDWAGRMGADVVNISFGGPSLFADGREETARYMDSAIARYGYTVCVSAGNSGPTLATVGAPATARRAVAVGAWAPASTQRTNYGVIDPVGGRLFGFSSRGPLAGGDPGVDFIAPGAAVSAVPEWALVAGRNMNGTSMAAPQMSGALAALISAARKEELPVTRLRLRRALERTAKPALGLTQVEQGYGLLDVHAALASLRDTAGAPEPVEWIVKANGPNGPGGGWFDRACTGSEPVPIVFELAPDLGRDPDPMARARFSRVLDLEWEVPWLEVAQPVFVHAQGEKVHAEADPTKLAPGLNVGTIRARDRATGREEARLTVTLLRPAGPAPAGEVHRGEIEIGPGDAVSRFYVVPPAATSVEVEITETDAREETRVSLRAPEFRVSERSAAARGGPTRTVRRRVNEGSIVEVAFHRRFQARGPSTVSYTIRFKGLVADRAELSIPTGRFGTHLVLRAAGGVKGKFEAKAEWLEEPLAFTWKTVPDPDGPADLVDEVLFRHEGVATFDVSAKRPELRIDLGFESAFDDYLDDAVYGIEDGNGKTVAKGHFWRGPFNFKPPRRGRYTLRITIWERGRQVFRGGALFSPALLTKIPARKLTVRQDLYEGLVPGGPSGATFAFSDGTRAGALFLRPKGAGTVRGTVTFKDDAWKTELLSLPLRIEPPAPPADHQVELARLLAAHLAGSLTAALDSEKVVEKERARIAVLVEGARAARVLTPALEARHLLLSARTGVVAEARAGLDALLERTPEKDAAGRQAVLRARAEAALLAGDAAKAEEDLRVVKGDDEDARRVRWLSARAAAKPEEALKKLDHYLAVAPPRPGPARDRFALLLELERFEDARDLIRGWSDRFPREAAEALELASRLTAAEKGR